MGNESNPNDSNFTSDGSLMESSEDGETEVDEARPSNAEVFHIDASIACFTFYRLQIYSLQKQF
jgi:hypothetical protein